MTSPIPGNGARRDNERPVIGMLFGFQVFGTGVVYGFIDSLTRGLHAAARDRHCNLLLACGMNMLKPQEPSPGWPVPAPDADFLPVGPWNTDGLIVVHPLLTPARRQYIRDLKASGFPIVFVGTAEGGPAIALDNDEGIRQALRHLIEHGHRRIAFIGGYVNDETGDSGVRLRAFQTAAQEYGLSADPRLIAYGSHQIAGGLQAMKQILSTQAPFTAVLASNDESALGVMQALAEVGLRVPYDVAVIGFDDRPDGALKVPPLTTVHHPVFERGYNALGLLLDQLENRRPTDDVVISVSTRLVVRRSCGCSLEDVVARAPNALSPPGMDDPASVRERLIQTAAHAILTETQHLNSAEIHQLSQRLVDAFIASVHSRQPLDFLSATQAILTRMEQTGNDRHVWALAIDALQSAPDTSAFARSEPAFVQAMLARARSAVAESTQRQYWREQNSVVSEVTGHLTARLLAALQEREILKILAAHLPSAGIRPAAVVLFEAEDDDPVAWSVMRMSADPDAAPVRFRSREFPPPAFSPAPDDVFNLALLPLQIDETTRGYMVFHAENLESCPNITNAVNTALKAARMYREALDGRRLAEEANELKSRFLSTVSHELRTPLSLILSNSELLLSKDDRNDSGMDRQSLARIRAGAQHLDGLIRDVLDLAVDELGELKLSYEPLDLATTLEPVAIVGEQLAHAKGLTWRVDIPAQLPSVWGDRARLRQVALNLVTNAVKFTSQGGVVLRVEEARNAVTIAVQDTGLGVPPNEQEFIFDEFRQSKRTTVRGYGGLGLGLAICKRLVEMHAGQIGVRSSGKEGAGAVFSVTLPTLEIGLEAVEKSLSREQTILLLDNPLGTGERLHAHLIEHGFTVQQMSIDDPTFVVAETTPPPGLVLIDAGVASGRGWEVMQTLKDNPATRELPVLFFSLTAQEQTSGSVLNLDYLTKPVGTTELTRALRRQGIGSSDVRTILVVDDDPGLLETHVRIVQSHSASYRVLQASNGKDALALVQKEHPDLILLDLMMPEMNGFEVLEAMQKMETARHHSVIVLTGQSLNRDEMARLDRSVAAVLSKGVFTVEETLAHIQQTLASRHTFGDEAQQLVRKAIAYIHENHAKSLTRTQIAQHLGISGDHLTRCFRQALHMPPMTYVTRYRISRAKILLESGEMTIADVAAAVGFSDQFYFSDVFRRETGITPSAYRKGRRSP